MKTIDDARLITKIAIPLALTMLVAAGLVGYARYQLDAMAGQTRRIVDVEVGRLTEIQTVRFAATEATVQDRNILVAVQPELIPGFKTRQDAAVKDAIAAVTRLDALADTPERHAINAQLREALDSYFAALARSTALGMKGEREAATKVARTDGTAARAKLRELVDRRVAALTDELRTAREDAQATAARAAVTLVAAAVVGLLLAAALAALIAVRAISRPLTAITGSMGRLAGGDLDVAVTGTGRRDEVGALARALAVFKDSALEARRLAAIQAEEDAAKMARADRLDAVTRGFQADATGLTRGLAAAATQMEATANAMTGTAAATTDRAVAVAAAADQTSGNVQQVAAATEELSISIQEITRQVAQSAQIAGEAVRGAQDTDRIIQELAATAERIGAVVAMISTIAGQTNLLALNATIEAARAGEAGRGFAVVATEVKELAGQTSRATDEITAQIGAVQQATREAVAAVRGIGQTIAGMADIATQVSAAMEEQGAATAEIARNVAEAARGTDQVTGSIGTVRAGAGETGAAAAQVLGAARELAGHAEGLERTVHGFLAAVKAA